MKLKGLDRLPARKSGRLVGKTGISNLSTLSSSDRIGIGGTPRGEILFNGYIGEIVVYSSILPESEQKVLSSRLMKKWGIK
jgi:hypothetical protein